MVEVSASCSSYIANAEFLSQALIEFFDQPDKLTWQSLSRRTRYILQLCFQQFKISCKITKKQILMMGKDMAPDHNIRQGYFSTQHARYEFSGEWQRLSEEDF